MHSANYVTVLDEGRVTHNQVAPDQLDRALIGAIERTSSRTGGGDAPGGEGVPVGSPSKTGVAASPNQQSDGQVDLKRATGDSSLYKFYFKSIGLLFSLSFLGLAIIWQALEKLGGMISGRSLYF